MDAEIPNPTGRKFPAFTTAQLRAAVTEGLAGYRTVEQLARMKLELERRDAGLSLTFHDWRAKAATMTADECKAFLERSRASSEGR